MRTGRQADRALERRITCQEIEQALKWAGAGADERRLNAHGMTPTAEQVFDILLSDPAYTEEKREGAR